MTYKRRVLSLLAALAMLAALALPSGARADNHYWIGGDTGSWDDTANWYNSIAPESGDYAYLFPYGGIHAARTVNYSGIASLGNLYVGHSGYRVLVNLGLPEMGTGSITLSQTGGSLTSTNEYIGIGASGRYVQSAGGNHTTNLYLGTTLGSVAGTGTYVLSSSGGLSAANEYIGNSGTGTFTQSAGVNDVSADLYLGNSAGSSGTYNLSSTGVMGAANEYVGYSGTGTFNQTGGSNTVTTGALILGHTAAGTGNYTLSGGILSALNQTVGLNGAGTFTHSAGTNTITNALTIGSFAGSTGTYTLSGSGSLSAVNEIVGDYGTGIFDQTGGTNTVNGTLTIGSFAGSTGTYILSGSGSLSAVNEIVGDYGIGTFIQAGGTNTVSGSILLGRNAGSRGTYILSGGELNVAGSILSDVNASSHFNLDGGTLNVGGTISVEEFALGYETGSNGEFTLGEGKSLSTLSQYIGLAGAGTFTQTGGSNTSEYSVRVGQNSNARGTYNLIGGSLSTDYETIGGSGAGIFTQTGGSNTITSGLYVGQSFLSAGAYSLSGSGTMSANEEYIGGWGLGSFTQTDGMNSVNTSLFLGASSSGIGTYDLSGTGTMGAKWEYIGDYGTGTFTQTGGTNWVSADLYLGSNAGGSGTYNLSGTGTLMAATEYIGMNGRGTFAQTGGINNITSDLFLGFETGSGSYHLSGTGDLSAFRESIGVSGTGNFTQTGGTHFVVLDLCLGSETGSTGTYDLSGTGSLSAGCLISVGNRGTGIFTQTGGTNIISGSAGNDPQLVIGGDASGIGTYILSGTGTLSVQKYETVGFLGTGTFIQTGGTNTIQGEDDSSLIIGSSTRNDGAYGKGSYTLSGTGILSAHNEVVGCHGTGFFTQDGGTNTVDNTLTIAEFSGSSGAYTLTGGSLTANLIQLNSGGTFEQIGGDLTYAEFNQNGGTVKGALQNKGMFNYLSGAFEGRLLNYGMTNFSVDFTAGNGMANYSNLFLETGRTITLNGDGLDNSGTMVLLGGTLGGAGVLTNNGSMTGYGTIAGTGGFVNNLSFVQEDDVVVLSNTGPSYNYGSWDLASGRQLRLEGSTLTNCASLNMNNGMIAGTGTLVNSFGGTIAGRGAIYSNFSNNGGTVAVESGALNIRNAFNNSGLIQVSGITASITGGAISNTGTVQGYGQVGNPISNRGTIEALGGTLTLGGATSNLAGGTMRVSTGNKILVMQGLSGNAGTISLTGGTFDNNNRALSNTGRISGYGTLATGGLTNSGKMSLSGSNGNTTTVNGAVANAVNGTIEVAYTPAVFSGDVVNDGTFKVTQTSVTFAGTFTNRGGYISDPAYNYFDTLIINSTGYLSGGLGDEFIMFSDFENNSTNPMWETSSALLGFTGGVSHNLTQTGTFEWGTLRIDGSDSLVLSGSGALNAGSVLGVDIVNGQVTNITGTDLDIYYLVSLADNAYLGGLTYDLGNGSILAPYNSSSVPIPGAVWLFATGLLGLIGLRRNVRG